MTAATLVSVRKDNPLCGDAIELDVTIGGGRVDTVAHRARACSLTKASARILAETVRGRTVDEARALATALAQAVQGTEPFPDGFAAVESVSFLPSRRGCVLLPWRALVEALGTI